MTLPLAGKAVAITGVTSGIGEALVTRVLAEGATAVGIARDAGKLAAAGARWGERFVRAQADLSDASARARCVAEVLARVPRIDAFVNNAAETAYELPSALALDAWRRLFEVNLLAGIDLVQRFVPAMPSGGHVVNVSSVTARFMPNSRFG